MPYIVVALYHFAEVDDLESVQLSLKRVTREEGIMGTILVAREGINGTVAGARKGIDALLERIRAIPGFDALEHKESLASEMPFIRMKVRLKKEIVALGQEGVDPVAQVGAYVPPKDWDRLVANEDVAVIDTRNDYEVAIGTFRGAVNPGTKSFREFPAWWRSNKDKFKGKRIAMFCTGGIRCEKASSYLLGEGVEEVFHLKGGILKYLEEIPESESSWDGSCFVFDNRVSVTHGLREGPHSLCYGCRRPLAPEDLRRPEYEEGICCHQCSGDLTEDQRVRFSERQRQVALAKKRGQVHIGSRETRAVDLGETSKG